MHSVIIIQLIVLPMDPLCSPQPRISAMLQEYHRHHCPGCDLSSEREQKLLQTQAWEGRYNYQK